MTMTAPQPWLADAFGPVVSAPLHSRQPRCVVALGDSVTAGVGDRTGPDARPGWAAHLAEALGAGVFHNLATIGARARDVRDRQLAVAVGMQPDLATLLIGGNDVLRGDFEPAAVGRDVEVICEALSRIDARVVVVLLPDPRDSVPGPRLVKSVLARRAEIANEAISSAVTGMSRVVLVDPRDRLDATDRSLWHIDRMHPGPLGHRAIARMVIGEIPWWSACRAIPTAPLDRPGRLRQGAWLIRHGAPWFVKRSRDLLPELARACWTERHLAAMRHH